MSKKDKAEAVETVKVPKVVETAIINEPAFEVQNANTHTLVNTRDWKRSSSTISHLSSIPEWYGQRTESLITAFINADGKLEILQGNQRRDALLYFGISDAPVKVYLALTEAERLHYSKDIIAKGLTKFDVYRSLWDVLNGLKTGTQWLKAIEVVSLQQMTETTPPKSGNLDWSEKEKKAIASNKSGKKGMSHDNAVASALLGNRWQGMKQGIDTLCGVSKEIADLFQYGLLCRNTGFFEKLPESSVLVEEVTKKDGSIGYKYSIKLDDPELQICAEMGCEDYALQADAKIFSKPVLQAPEAELIDIDVDMSAFCAEAVDSDVLQEAIYTAMTSTMAGAETLKAFDAKFKAELDG
jgi:hypothetical protein